MPAETPGPSRRQLLGGLGALGAAAGLGLLPGTARALGQASHVDIAELVLPRGTLSRPAAWQRLLYEVQQSTSVEVNPESVQLDPEDPALFEHPFCVLTGDAALPELSEAAVQQLVRYLSYGGFLLFDDASGSPEGAFGKSVARLCSRMFPTRPLSPLPGDHSVYRAFFLLDRPLGRLALRDTLDGVTMGPVTPLVYCPNDLSGALDRNAAGQDRFPVVPGGSLQRKEAVKLGINLVLYALTSNYKHDQAHVAELMREGRLE